MVEDVLHCSLSAHAEPSLISCQMIKRAIPEIRRESKADTVFLLSHSSLMRTDSCGAIPVSQQRLFHPAKVKRFGHLIFCDINKGNTERQAPCYLTIWQSNSTQKPVKAWKEKGSKRKKLNLCVLRNARVQNSNRYPSTNIPRLPSCEIWTSASWLPIKYFDINHSNKHDSCNGHEAFIIPSVSQPFFD